MGEEELKIYYQDVRLWVGVQDNFIDFEDTERPIKSSITSVATINVDT